MPFVALFLATFTILAAACSGSTPTPVPATATPVPATKTPTIPTIAAPVSPTPTKAPTGIPTPTSQPTPTASPVATPAPVSVSPLTETVLSYLNYLVKELGPRESATQQELAGAEYLASLLEGFGYSVELQPFTITTLSAELSALTVDGLEPQTPDVIPLEFSPEGEASGSLVAIGLGREGDLPEGGLTEKIALIQRGIIQFQDKVIRAAEAGAIAVVIYNNLPGNFRGTLTRATSIPSLAISQGDGERIEELLASGPMTASVSVKAIIKMSRNVVATKPVSGPGLGSSHENKTVILGGHYDTVPNVSGANDNSSGTAVFLALAKELIQESLPFTVRFIGFGSEELGLRGSQHYVASLTEDEKDGIIAMFNFDALGSGLQAGVLGDVELITLAIEQADSEGISVLAGAGLRGGGSDHMSFSAAGILVLMFYALDFSRIHTASDTLEFVDPGLLGDAAKLALAMLRSPDFLTALD